MRYFLKFSYNGTKYHGWQIQPNAVSVQEVLTSTMSTIFGHKITLTGAGRTDTGVHAREMFAHFDLDAILEVPLTIFKINALLPADIAIIDMICVHDNAHARFDAKKRTYQYHVHTNKNPFLDGISWYYRTPLDIMLMNKAAEILLKYTDFESFSKTNTDVNTYNCTIYEAFWTTQNGELVFTISADRFLRNMVRAIVGTLINVGLKKITIAEFATIIDSKNRTKAGFSVPACGLFLTKIKYDYIEVLR